MVKTVVRSLRWPPEVIDALFLDAIDRHGLEYWYNDIKEVVKELKGKK